MKNAKQRYNADFAYIIRSFEDLDKHACCFSHSKKNLAQTGIMETTPAESALFS